MTLSAFPKRTRSVATGALPVPLPESSEGPSPNSKSYWRQSLSSFAESKSGVAGVVVLVVIVLFCWLGPVFYHTNQSAANLLLENQAPSAQHLLGMTPEGRDELGALMLGGQSTLVVGLSVGVLSTLFGLVWGVIAGYVGGFIDSLMMRIVDALLAIPFLFFVILLASLVTPSLVLIIVVIGAVSWLSTARLARGETLTLRTYEYVAASRVFGARSRFILRRHVAPNLLGVVVVNSTLKVADAIALFAYISFLGLGVPPPATSWGDILTDGITNLFDGYWWQLWPAAVLFVATVVAANLIGDALSDLFEPRLAAR
jgi:ABC-type dipeptide/oligopeptide/nickel transport system permease subunit